MSSKDKDGFIALELESRGITSALRDITERRLAMERNASKLVLSKFETFTADFDAWTVHKAERLMVQLRAIVVEMSVVRRKAIEREPSSEIGFQMEQEYFRKLQLLDTLRSLSEFSAVEAVEFFNSFEQAWRSDSSYGCLK